MYDHYIPSHLPVAAEIKAYQDDLQTLGVINDEKNWYVTKEWAAKFRKHFEKMLPLAQNGDPLAQYQVATIYMIGCLYDSESEMMENHEKDSIEMTNLLLLSAKQGVVAALDNVLVNGVGTEAERLRQIYQEVKDENGNASFKKIMERAYGASC